MKLLVTLSPGVAPKPYGTAIVIDWRGKRIIDDIRYPLTAYEESHKSLAGAELVGNRIWVGAEGEVGEIELAPLRIVRTISKRTFNDVHHVAVGDDSFWVCNTGMDSIDEYDTDWNLVKSHDLVAAFGRRFGHVARLLMHDIKKSWRRRGDTSLYSHLTHRPPFRSIRKLLSPAGFNGQDIDFRKADLRPHILHPNFVQPMGDDLWVTLLMTGEIVSLKERKVLTQGLGRPHDGKVVGETCYVTDYQGRRLVVMPVENGGLGQAEVIDLSPAENLGFARGVAATPQGIFVGSSAFRNSTGAARAARVIEVNGNKVAGQWTIPTEYGLGVYSVIDVTHLYD